MRYTFLSLGLLLLVAACSDNSTPYDNMAKELCVCNQDLISMYQEIQEMMSQEKQAEAMAMLDQFDLVAEAQETCAAKVFEQYGEPETEEEEAAAMEALEQHCPALVEMLTGLDMF